MRRTLATLFIGAAIAACSGSSSAPGSGGNGGGTTVMGTVNGKPFTPADAIALKGVYDPAYPGIVAIVMGNMPNLCALFQQLQGIPGNNATKANFVDLGFVLGQTIASSTVGTGTYTPSGMPNELDTAGWDSYDSSCKPTRSTGTSSATVTLDSVGAVYAGTFDITFTGGEHVSGSFNAPLCTLNLPDGGGVSGGANTCIQ